MLSDLRHRVRALFRRQAVEDELDEELRFHLEQQTRKLVERGMTPQEAARQARIALGGIDQVKEEHRRARGVDLIETTLQDVRYGFRSLRRHPGFTTTALLTLALTTGAVSSVLCLANAMVWRPMPVPRPDRLVAITTPQGKPSWGRVSYVDYRQVRDHTATLQGLAAHVGGFAPFWAVYNDRAGELNGAIVSANLFTVLSLTPARGRFFSADEDSVPDRDRVAVISHRLWREAWNGSPAVIGADIKLYGVPFKIVGVAPAHFHGVVAQRADVYIPTTMLRVLGIGCEAITDPDCATLGLIGRLRDGRTFGEAGAEIPTLAPTRWKTAAAGDAGAPKLIVSRPRGAWGALGGQRLRDWSDGRPLVSVAACCLLLGCANLAGLLVARGSSRARELAIRPSLGATPLRLLRQLMTESLLLAVLSFASAPAAS